MPMQEHPSPIVADATRVSKQEHLWRSPLCEHVDPGTQLNTMDIQETNIEEVFIAHLVRIKTKRKLTEVTSISQWRTKKYVAKHRYFLLDIFFNSERSLSVTDRKLSIRKRKDNFRKRGRITERRNTSVCFARQCHSLIKNSKKQKEKKIMQLQTKVQSEHKTKNNF